MSETYKKIVLLFGSFDGIHRGHEYLINEARKYGPKIIIVVAHDVVIQSIKKQLPINPIGIRIKHLEEKFNDLVVVPGDLEKGTWSVIKEYLPTTIIVGYDQEGLHRALLEIQANYGFSIVQTESFEPEKYKSSLLRNKKNPS